MPTVELSHRAVENLEALIVSHSLPASTRGRVRRALAPLAEFPRLGRRLSGRWAGHRVLLGPWRWMLFVYRIDGDRDRVVVVTVQDARTSAAVTRPRGGN